MKVFYRIRRNKARVKGWSSEVWKIQQQKRRVTIVFGPVRVPKKRPIPIWLRSRKRSFKTEDEARKFEAARIRRKTDGGYYRSFLEAKKYRH